MFLPWFLCGVCGCIAVLLCIKLMLVKRGMRELCQELKHKLEEETNTSLTLSTRDFHIRMLARELNLQLSQLCKQRQEYETGNRELKESVTNISHDFRTPLTAISGYLELLEDVEIDPEARRYIDIITNRVELMKQLSEELFRYSIAIDQPNTKTKQIVVLNDLIEEGIASFYPVLKEKGIEPDIHLPNIKVTCYLDAAAFSRILSNLLQNAIKYSDGDLSITLSRDGELTFMNTASSLSEVQVARLFDRFYTVQRVEASTGLGLEITRNLIHRMNGTIIAEYKEQKLCIRITLPDTES